MPILTNEERVGSLIAGKYRLDAILGRGGMAVVFAGTHTWTDRPVAVKILNPEYARDARIARRFLQEARTATRLRHPNVVDVLDMGEDAVDGTVYLVLELLEGETLADVLERDGTLPAKTALDIVLPVMQALVAAHRLGIVHRDLKPDNIFLNRDPHGRTIPKLLDFGIAKVVESASSTSATGIGNVIGTPFYMSPEQAAGAPDIGPPADIWSVGVVLYECLSGFLPFTGSNPTAVLLAIAVGKAMPLGERLPLVPSVLTSAIDRALIPDRRDRYARMREFVDALVVAARESGIVLDERLSLRPMMPTPEHGHDRRRLTPKEAPPRSPPPERRSPRPDEIPLAPAVPEDFETVDRARAQTPTPASPRTPVPSIDVDMSGPGTTSTPLAIVSPVASWRARVLGAPRTRLGMLVGGAAILVVAIIVVAALSFGSEDEAAHARPPDDRVDLVAARAAEGASADAGISHAGLPPHVAAEPPSTAGVEQGDAAGTSTAPQTIGAVTDPNALGARRRTRRGQTAADPARPAKRTPSIVREW